MSACLSFAQARTTPVRAIFGSEKTSSPIVISHGGTYSGNWRNEDPGRPAITIQTNEPVTIKNATVASRGTLIQISAVPGGANVTVDNVSATALDPGMPGKQRGAFLSAASPRSLRVTNCTIIGASFGIRVVGGHPYPLIIQQNLARELDDRASDGRGGFLPQRPDLGHFIFLNGVQAPQGADISWNEDDQTVGRSSEEDVINIYKSQGTPSAPILVHDNLIEGYTYACAFQTGIHSRHHCRRQQGRRTFDSVRGLRVELHCARRGIGSLHRGWSRCLASDNHVVSCGKDENGAWIVAPYANAAVVWNEYGSPDFAHNEIVGTKGGLVHPDQDGKATPSNLWDARKTESGLG